MNKKNILFLFFIILSLFFPKHVMAQYPLNELLRENGVLYETTIENWHTMNNLVFQCGSYYEGAISYIYLGDESNPDFLGICTSPENSFSLEDFYDFPEGSSVSLFELVLFEDISIESNTIEVSPGKIVSSVAFSSSVDDYVFSYYHPYDPPVVIICEDEISGSNSGENLLPQNSLYRERDSINVQKLVLSNGSCHVSYSYFSYIPLEDGGYALPETGAYPPVYQGTVQIPNYCLKYQFVVRGALAETSGGFSYQLEEGGSLMSASNGDTSIFGMDDVSTFTYSSLNSAISTSEVSMQYKVYLTADEYESYDITIHGNWEEDSSGTFCYVADVEARKDASDSADTGLLYDIAPFFILLITIVAGYFFFKKHSIKENEEDDFS